MTIKEKLQLHKDSFLVFFKESLKNKHIGLIKDKLPLDYKSLVINFKNVNFLTVGFSEMKTHVKISNTSSYNYILKWKLDLIAEIRFEHLNSIGATKLINKRLLLNVNILYDSVNHMIQFEIYDENQDIINKYFRLIENKYQEYKINSLVDDNYKINNKPPVVLFIETTRKRKLLKNDYYVFNNLGRISQDLKYLLTILILYHPYISDFLENEYSIDGQAWYYHVPNLYDKQYLFTSGLLCELIYNYWDQIGDILAEIFVPNLKERDIYFGKVIDNFPSEYYNSLNYIWFKNFKNSEYSSLNEKRKKIVHYKSIESEFYDTYQRSSADRKVLIKLEEEKNGLVKYFKNQQNIVMEGFEYLIKMIEEKNL